MYTHWYGVMRFDQTSSGDTIMGFQVYILDFPDPPDPNNPRVPAIGPHFGVVLKRYVDRPPLIIYATTKIGRWSPNQVFCLNKDDVRSAEFFGRIQVPTYFRPDRIARVDTRYFGEVIRSAPLHLTTQSAILAVVSTAVRLEIHQHDFKWP